MRFPGPTHLVAGFQHRADAERFLRDFQERLAKFGLEVHPEKTRLIEFGRFATSERRKRGQGKPETFTFLGFTHFCGTNSRGQFVVWRHTAAKRMRAKLRVIQQELRRMMHEPVVIAGAWLKRVVEGYYQYHAVPGNLSVLSRFQERLCRYWRHVLRGAVTGESQTGTICGLSSSDGFLVPALFILIPMYASTLVSKGGAVCGNSARTDLRGGWAVMLIPTATPSADQRPE